MTDPCCHGELAYLLLQINIVCLLLALLGSAAITRHAGWFGPTDAIAAHRAEETHVR